MTQTLPTTDPEAIPKTESETPPPETPTINEVSIDVPLGDIPPGAYIPLTERTEFRTMTRKQGRMLTKLTRGLQDAGRTLEDGTRIKRFGQALRWLLEQLDQEE